MSSAGCAKLMTPVALKITTKPSASRAYTAPSDIPPIRSWRKFCTSSLPGRQVVGGQIVRGRVVRGRVARGREPVVAAPEIGAQHFGVLLHLLRGAVGDTPAEVEHR